MLTLPRVPRHSPLYIQTYLYTLSDSVDPTARSLAVALPPDLDYSAPR